MILDNQNFLSGSVSAAGVLTGQLLTANSTLSTNTLDMAPLTIGGNQAVDAGQGEPFEIAFGILVAPATATDLQFQLIQADDAALTTNVQVLCATAAIPVASLPAGTVVPLHYDRAAPFPPKRYVGVRYVATGATITAASVTAAIVKNIADVKNIYFKSGYAVS